MRPSDDELVEPIPAKIELPLVICDTETTGLSPSQHRVIEVAYARIDQGHWDKFVITTNRFKPSLADYARGDRRAYLVNGYYPKHADWDDAPVLDSPESIAAWKKIATDLTDVILINQKVSFDAEMLLSEMSRHSPYAIDEAPWGHRTWEVGAFTKLHMKAVKEKGWKLSRAYDVLRGPPLPPHRAEADVLRAIWVLAFGIERYPDVWPDFRFEVDAAKAAVERWSNARWKEHEHEDL